ncbi:MAG: S26 family signal peptidase, partial [Candidatus Auribacterota bacterium]|nr:S26 family signal peptidase [Candidatus Auribacterota bacterium]
MNRELRKLKKQARGSLKAGRWIVKHRRNKLSSDTIENLRERITRLQSALRDGDLKASRRNLNKLNGILSGKAASARKSKFREWTESILFALIMVFIIRTFIVQPFKIPTGSMTPTLLGVKKVCPLCGRNYRYDVKTCPVDG